MGIGTKSKDVIKTEQRYQSITEYKERDNFKSKQGNNYLQKNKTDLNLLLYII